MAVRSSQLVAASVAVSSSHAVLFTAPAGDITVVKSITLWAPGSAGTVTLFLKPNGSSNELVIAQAAAGAAVPTQIGCFICLNAGDVIDCSTAVGTGAHVVIGGAKLVL